MISNGENSSPTVAQSHKRHPASPERAFPVFIRSFIMRRPLLLGTAFLQIVLGQALPGSPAVAQVQPARPHNVVLFIADGLRFRMVDDNTAPTMAAIARQRVRLRNGNALFPAFTIAHAYDHATRDMLTQPHHPSNT